MPAPLNLFKAALKRGETQIGYWLNLGDANAAELVGTAGFDWLVLDGEHAPYDLKTIREQLVALETSSSHPVVRIPIGADWIIKQVLDVGCQTVLVPMVESADAARALAAACRYPPDGVRGMGGAGSRVTQFSALADYVTTANDQICLLVQVETRAGVTALDEILAVKGVDGVFIGPADLSADMGYPGNSAAPEVAETIKDCLARIKAAGKAPGILGLSDSAIEQYREFGAQFLAVGIDSVTLARTVRAHAARWKC